MPNSRLFSIYCLLYTKKFNITRNRITECSGHLLSQTFILSSELLRRSQTRTRTSSTMTISTIRALLYKTLGHFVPVCGCCHLMLAACFMTGAITPEKRLNICGYHNSIAFLSMSSSNSYFKFFIAICFFLRIALPRWFFALLCRSIHTGLSALLSMILGS